MNAAMLLLVASTLAAPQAPQTTSTTPSLRVMRNTTFVTDGRQQQPAGATTHQMAGRTVMVHAQGGLITGIGDTGFLVGVGVSAQPGSNEKVEVMGDINIGRVFETNVLYVSFNGIYDVHMQGHDAMPFVGGGLAISHASGDTDVNLQLIGGVQLPVKGKHVVRVSVRFLFTDGSPVLLLVGYSF